MGSSSSSSNSNRDDRNGGVNERFQFRFTDCSCQCDASKKRLDDLHGPNDLPQAAFLTALMSQTGRAQYDIRCDCDCGDGVKMGFLFGNTPSNSPMTDHR